MYDAAWRTYLVQVILAALGIVDRRLVPVMTEVSRGNEAVAPYFARLDVSQDWPVPSR